MKKTIAAATVLGLASASAQAGGLDRSGQSVSSIFNDNGTFALTFQHTSPKITGEDALGNEYDVGEDYTQIGLSYTRDIGQNFTLGVIYDQPYGADILYNNDPLSSTLGGTRADLNSQALTVLGKYRFGERFSVFGGVKLQEVDAEVDLNGLAYSQAISVSAVAAGAGVDSGVLGAALQGDIDSVIALGGPAVVQNLGLAVQGQIAAFGTSGYQFEMDKDTRPGALIGAAYEIPDIALRFAVTYHFEIEHEADTVENLFGMTVPGSVEYVTPQSLNVEFQTGIAQDTLLTAGYRWTDFSAVDVVPDLLGSDLVNLDDSHRYSIGVARRFNENLVGSISVQYEGEGDDLVSPLGPTNGSFGVSVGGRYTQDNVNISGGINYTKLGDAEAEVGGASQASFSDSSALTLGFQVQVTF